MIQQMGLWFEKTKGGKRHKQTMTMDKQEAVAAGACVCWFVTPDAYKSALEGKSQESLQRSET